MKKAIIIILACVLCLAALAAGAVGLVLGKNKIVKPTDLGVPYLDIYAKELVNSRLSDDMTVFDGKLYVGGGDYGANTGPVYVMSYDLERGVWEKSAETLPDEQIKRFALVGGELAILGTDPKEDWTMGNYYLLRDGKWETLRVLPSGIHCFDYTEFDGDGFFGLGVNSGDCPVVRFDGESYTAVGFYKDGEPLDTSVYETVRVYNLFEYRGELYAFFTFDKVGEDGAKNYYMDLYRYDGEVFEYAFGSIPAEDMPDIVTTDSAAYLVMNRTLLVTHDLTGFSGIALGKDIRVSDIIESDGSVFVLGWKPVSENYYEITVFEGNDGEFEKRFGFFAYATAGSFCKDGDRFYISLGERENPALIRDAGRVVAIGQRSEFVRTKPSLPSVAR